MAGRMLPTISRLKSLVREKVKPVPAVDIRQITLGVDPIVVAGEYGEGTTHFTLHVFQEIQMISVLQRGPRSRFADPTELRSLITSTDFNLNSGILSNY